MEEKTLQILKRNWHYLHPLTKALILIEYYMEHLVMRIKRSMSVRRFKKKRVFKKWFPYIPRIAAIMLVVFLTKYTLTLFSDTPVIYNPKELLVYLLPSIILLVVLELTLKFEKIGGIVFLTLAFGFLFIYHAFVSIGVFFLLVTLGLLFLIDAYTMHGRH